MRRNPQRGMTLVELLVSMAVMSIILVGLSGAFFNTTAQYQRWADRLGSASTGLALAASLQADSHRYVPCGDIVNHATARMSTLGLCPPDNLSRAAVTYAVSSRAPFIITRAETGKSPAFMARSETAGPPELWADCYDGGGTVGGHIHVYNFRATDGSGIGGELSTENFSVYYVAPWRPGCS